MRNRFAGTVLACVALCLLLLGCGTTNTTSNNNAPIASQAQASNQNTSEEAPQASEGNQTMSTSYTTQELWVQNGESAETNAVDTTLQMSIDGVNVDVDWESNESVEALKELCQNGPLTIGMSMYGGFEQVGSIGQSLPANDTQMTTQAGDIVLYAKSQIVVFYGSNSWAYTKLGHIANKSNEEMAQLLGSGDVTIIFEQGQ